MTDAVADFGAFMGLDEIEYEIKAIDGVTGTGWKWTICDPSHSQALAYTNRQSRKTLNRNKQIEQARVNGRKWTAEDTTPDDERRDTMEFLASRIIGWSPIKLPVITGNDEPIPFSQENVIKVLMERKLGFVFTQIVEVITEDKNFTKRSGSTSEPSPNTTSLSGSASQTAGATAST